MAPTTRSRDVHPPRAARRGRGRRLLVVLVATASVLVGTTAAVVTVGTPARADDASVTTSTSTGTSTSTDLRPVAATAVPRVVGGQGRPAAARALVQRVLEGQVLALTNRERRLHGCANLRSSRALIVSARRHTVAMAAAGTMSHQLPGEPFFSARITNAGYRNWRLVAENIAQGFSGPVAVVKAWMGSPGHRRNILDCRLRDLGVGVVLLNGELWWTQNFGWR
ncbi:CAP domain-containing protein [Nocardioides sp.]|uniref:CAP domain-containing protein n=1 Tax=Nocardioides sp. TaxID=35761 RepID=UPI0035199EF3